MVSPDATPAPAPDGTPAPADYAVARWVIGESFDHDPDPAEAPPADAAARKDTGLAFGGVSKTAAGHSVKLTLDADYDPASTHNRLARVRVYLVPDGSPLPGSPDGFLRSSHRFSEHNTGAAVAGDELSLALPAGTKGRHAGVVLLGFAS